MTENKAFPKNLPDHIKDDFQTFTHTESLVVVALFVTLLTVLWFVVGKPSTMLLVVYPREPFSISSILFSNFFHANIKHLIGNLLLFVPLGFFVFKAEGVRGVIGIFYGMIAAGVAVWLFGDKNSISFGFSGAVMACWGILFVYAIRVSFPLTAIFLVLSFVFMEFSLFETIRPTTYTDSQKISWLGHLGGLIGGMASQIRSLTIALELLYKENKVTEEEFVAIATRIHKGENLVMFDEKPPEQDKTDSKVE